MGCSISDPNPTTSGGAGAASPGVDYSHLLDDGWSCYKDDDVLQQQAAIEAEEAEKSPLVGSKEPITMLAAEYQTGNCIIQEKIKILSEKYGFLRRTRGDGNCFFRAFMFSYLEHLLETQDKDEVNRVSANVEQCRKTLQNLGYSDFTFEDFFGLFTEQLEAVVQGTETSISPEELLQRCQDVSISNYLVMFFRFITTGEIRKREGFFEPFIMGLSDATVDQFCKTSVEPMGAESDHVQIIALSDALGVPIRVMYLDRSSGNSTVTVNHHDFIPSDDQSGSNQEVEGAPPAIVSVEPFVTLLYRPGHYDILYLK